LSHETVGSVQWLSALCTDVCVNLDVYMNLQ